MICPTVHEEREVKVCPFKPKLPSPIAFNIHLDSERCAYVLGVTFEEAKELYKQLGERIDKEIMKE